MRIVAVEMKSCAAWGALPFLMLVAAASSRADQAADTRTKDGGLAEIVVTAQKRQEDPKEVPISLTAISGPELVAEHINSMEDLTRAVPDVSYSGASGTGSGAGLGNIEIRGISSQGGQSTVGIYLDDVALDVPNTGTMGQPEPKFFDLERIEVLRGPQGTLFGAGSEGGTIRFVSKQPELNTYSGSVSSELSGTQGGGINWKETGIVNIPLIDDRMAARIGVQINHKDGYIDQISPYTGQVVASNINGESDIVAKAAVKWQVTDQLTIKPAMFYQHTDLQDLDTAFLTYFGPPLGLSGPTPIDTTAKLIREPAADALYVPSLTFAYDVGFADLTSITSHYKRNINVIEDVTEVDSLGLYSYAFDPTSCNGLLAAQACQNLYTQFSQLPSVAYVDNTVNQIAQEIRLASKPYDPSRIPLTWIAGVYFSSQSVRWTDNEYTPGLDATFAGAGLTQAEVNSLVGWSTTPPANSATSTYSSGAPFPNQEVFFSNRNYDTRQIAGFGEATYYAAPTVRFTAGLRYLYATSTFSRDAGAYWNYDYVWDHPPPSHTYATTPKFAFGWDVSPEDTVYVTISKGFRLGNVNRPVQVNSCVLDGTQNGMPSSACTGNLKSYGFSAFPNSYGPDSLWNYEVGDKARLFDNHLSIDVAAFYIDWKNIQQTLELPQGWSFITNTGDARIYGFEWDVKGAVLPGLTLSTSGSFNRAVIQSTGLVLNHATGEPYQNVPVEGVPVWNAKIGALYERPLSDDMRGFFRIDTTATGNSHGTFVAGDPDYDRPIYSLTTLSSGVDIGKDYSVSLFVKNLFDNRTVIQQPSVDYLTLGLRNTPRTIGVMGSVAF
jgi:outer membrane receptor protein involved in Fe transport